jgi:microcin C transport system substrate-binding protein
MVVGRGKGGQGQERMMRVPALALGFAAILCGSAAAEPRHGASIFGDLKYGPEFSHLDYVNPDAPKGGRLTTIGTAGITTFDSFNGYILKGDAAQGIELIFDTLMVRAFDEPDAMYGLAAESIDVAPDRKSVSFALRPEAKFADGTALTAEDVCDTFRLIKTEGHERIRITIRDVKSCSVLSPQSVRYDFEGENTRDLPLIVAGLPIFSKAYYQTHDFTKSTLEPPLGSGPYKIGPYRQGQYVSYLRREDYWAKDLPVNRGKYNFDEIRFEYFRDRNAELEALKAGILDLREEFTSKSWATEYNISAVKEGRLIKEELPDETMSGAQGFFINLRREKFQDVRVREALDLAFDFEWSNANLFYNLYTRTASVFEGGDLKASGKPSPEELELLDQMRGDLRPEVFEEVYNPPRSNGSGADRKLLRQASELLEAAGWAVKDGVRENAKGEKLTIEFLEDDQTFERVMNPYIRNLRLIGIDARIRLVDEAQFQQRLKDFDYDITIQRYVLEQTPGVELRSFFGSQSAQAPGSYNLSGIALKSVDWLIDKIITAKSREELTIAARALDRVLRAEHFWVPHWAKRSYTIVYWDIFDRPAVKPKYDRGIITNWWIDKTKAANLRRGP